MKKVYRRRYKELRRRYKGEGNKELRRRYIVEGIRS